jgi:hypothetical protein
MAGCSTSSGCRALRLELLLTLLLCLAAAGKVRAQAEAGASARAQSQASSAELERQAGDHFERGVELYSEGSLDAALVEFERAYELVPSYRILYNLAQIQAERHEYAAALGLFEKYLAEGGGELAEPRKAEARKEISKLRERLAELWVDTDVEGAKLFVNDQLVGVLPLAQPVAINSGICRVRIEKAGYRPATREFKVVGGDHARLSIPLRALAGSELAGPDSPQSSEATSNYKPLWISSAAALALGGAALTFAVSARAADQRLQRELDRFPASKDNLAADRSKLKTYAGLADGLAAGSVVALGLAVYFLIAPPKSASSGQDMASGKTLRVLPRVGGLELRGTF